jgi:LPXTG-motif cell wall-anchored protein
MHRRLAKSLATLMGTAALIVAPFALLAPSASAATLTTPDDRVEGTAEHNQVDWWEESYLPSLTPPITGATCTKIDPGGTSYTLPALPSGTEYAIVVTKAADENALPPGEKANWVFWSPEAGDVVTAVQGKGISHVIVCTVKTKPSTPSTPSTPTKPTGPVVETDRVAETGSSTGLGLLAAGALIAGAGAVILSRRRQGAHR